MRAGRLTAGTPSRVRFLVTLAAALAAVVLLLPGVASAATGTGVATVQTKVSPSVSLGGSLSDSAQLVGSQTGTGLGAVPTGTITFKLYGPDDPTCSHLVYTSPAETLMTQGNIIATAASGAFPPTVSGTYRFVAVYSGDGNYAPQTTPCGDPNETVQVTDVTPKLTTVASPSTLPAGSPVTDTATLSGGKAPTGSITFLLFPPSDPTCTGHLVVAKSTVPVSVASDPSSIVSPAYTPTAAGTYHWVASYSGDAHNGAVSGACSDAGESVVVTAGPAPPGGSGGSSPPGSSTPGGAGAPCDPVATAKAVLAGIAASLTGQPGAAFKNSCSAGLRIVLRAKEIRPGNPGTPHRDGFTTMANDLTHIAPTGPALGFSLNSSGLALRSYALGHHRSLIAFLVVHVRKDKTSVSTESLQILTLG